LLVLIMIVITFVFILPYEWMFTSAFKTDGEIFRYAWPISWKTFFPPQPTLDNFRSVFVEWGFGRNLANSAIAAVCQMTGTLAVCSLAAFALTRLHFRGSNLLFALVMLVALVPFEVIMVPLYVTARQLGITNTYPALFLPWIANPFGIFQLRQAFMEIPRDFDEAAMIEGASPFQIFWYVILPNAKPALITLALMSFLWSWNAFMWPLIVMQDARKQVIQVAIATFTLPYQLPEWGAIFAGATLATLPVLILFILLQRYYVRSALMSGLKG
jgi:ABC-type glycerol-3-phosphate transport system permease component